jgi:nucleoside-diphosphate-sugar epimerase
MTSQEKCLLLGFGDIARRLSARLIQKFAVTGVRRQPETIPGLAIKQADSTCLNDMIEVVAEGFDVIVLTMTPSKMSDAGYEQAYVKTAKVLLAALATQVHQPRLIVFVSSTSVYGQQRGESVSEDSLSEPPSFSGKRLLEAETILANSPYPSCAVRFSGIYGPGRLRLIDQVLAGKGASKEPVLYSNRIHADDCVGVLAHLIAKQKIDSIDPLYLATDCQPTPLYDVKQWLAEQLDLPKQYLQAKASGQNGRSSKRCNNQRLLDSGYEFQYPTFRQGYGAVLENLKTP